MGALVGVGGIIVPADKARALELSVNEICGKAGLPKGEAFKWSPGKALWMRNNLKARAREEFFCAVLNAANATGAKALVTIEDKTRKVACGSATHEQDAITLAIERFQTFLQKNSSYGIVIAAQPRGGASDETRLLAECRALREIGTTYVKFQNLAAEVLLSPLAIFAASAGKSRCNRCK
jgi:hypothetical protein